MAIDQRILDYINKKRNRKQYDEGVDPALVGALSKSFSQLGTHQGKTPDTSAVENYSNLLSRKRDLESQRQRDLQEQEDQTYIGGINQDIKNEQQNKKLQQDRELAEGKLASQEEKENFNAGLDERRVAAQEKQANAHANYYNNKQNEVKIPKETSKERYRNAAIEKSKNSLIKTSEQTRNALDSLDRLYPIVAQKQGSLNWSKVPTTTEYKDFHTIMPQLEAYIGKLEEIDKSLNHGDLEQARKAAGNIGPGFSPEVNAHAIKTLQDILTHKHKERESGHQKLLEGKELDTSDIYNHKVGGNLESEWKVGKNGKRFRILPPDKDGNPQIEEE